MQRTPSRLRDLLIPIFVASSFLLSCVLTAQQDAAQPPPRDIGARPGHLPKVHYLPSRASSSNYPFWVDASMLLNADGSVNTTLLHPAAVRLIQILRATPPAENGCVHVGHTFEDLVSPPDRNTPEQATRNSRLVLLGTVTERAYGFAGDEPGQLLRVRPDEALKGQPRNVPAYFVFLPVGTFKIGGLKICKTDDHYSDPPAVGEQVLLFVPDDPAWQQDQNDPYIELMDEAGLIAIHADSSVSLPKRFRTNSHGVTISSSGGELLERVRTAAAGKEVN